MQPNILLKTNPEIETRVVDDWIINNKSELVMITGANGFVGFKVVGILLEYGFKRIRCLVRSNRKINEIQRLADAAGAEMEIVQGNLLSRDDCKRAVQDVALIIHLAAGIGKSFADCFLNSAVATRNLLDAALEEKKIKRLVNISSLAVYSGFSLRRGAVLDENSPIESDHMARFDAYSYGKIKQDEMVTAYGNKFNLPYVIVRPGVVYGPGKRQLTGRVGTDSFGIYLHMGGSNRIPIIYIDNCAEAIVMAGLKKGIDGEVFIAVDDDLPTSRKFLHLYKKNTGYFLSIFIPYRLNYFLNWLWEKYSKWSEGQLPPVFNRRNCATYYQKLRYSNHRLKEKVGWKPRINFPEATQRYFDYMRNGKGEK